MTDPFGDQGTEVDLRVLEGFEGASAIKIRSNLSACRSSPFAGSTPSGFVSRAANGIYKPALRWDDGGLGGTQSRRVFLLLTQSKRRISVALSMLSLL